MVHEPGGANGDQVEIEIVQRKKVQHVGKGEFVVNVRPWLPERLRNVVFRDQYVVALVGGGGDEDVSNVETGFAEMIGVARNMKQKGLSKLEVEKYMLKRLKKCTKNLRKESLMKESEKLRKEGQTDRMKRRIKRKQVTSHRGHQSRKREWQ